MCIRDRRKAVETIETELADIERQIADFDARFASASAYDAVSYTHLDVYKRQGIGQYAHLLLATLTQFAFRPRGLQRRLQTRFRGRQRWP